LWDRRAFARRLGAGEDREYDLPVHIIVETFEAPGPNDKGRCLGASSVEFPEIRNAKSYRVVTKDVKYGAGTMDQVGPPFPADHRVYGPRTGMRRPGSTVSRSPPARPGRAVPR
jgi:hypothetical protein